MFADFVNRHDVWVMELGDRSGLGVEPFHLLTVGQLSRQDHFHCYNSIQASLPGLVHHPHPAMRDLFQQLVITQAIYDLRFTIYERKSDAEPFIWLFSSVLCPLIAAL
jgi:hypothetical protein